MGDIPEAVEGPLYYTGRHWQLFGGGCRPPGHRRRLKLWNPHTAKPFTYTQNTQVGIENVLAAAAAHLGVAGGAPLLRPTPDFAARWGALDDGG